jgi:uncharacterized phage-associated protein
VSNPGLVSAEDVAAAIIQAAPRVDRMKLQKLLYFAQAWYLAWYDEPMFNDVVQAWKYGPAIPSIHKVYGAEHEGSRDLIQAPLSGTPGNLDEQRRAALDAVLEVYGEMDAQTLAALSKEGPLWRGSRRGLTDDENGHQVMPRGKIAVFFRREGRPPGFGDGERVARELGLSV